MTDVSSPVLQTPSGTVSGTLRGDGTRVFRAVPVTATHDTADTRFAEPLPAPRWEGILACPDTDERLSLRDTHTATVYAPAEDGTPGAPATAPVIVFIHGGRYELGHGDEPWYDGGVLARAGCVVVSVNYRKRFEGFLPLADDPSSSDTGTDQPRGVQDLLAALHWVREVVGGLGGDPGNVTLAGQSAGAGLIAWLLTVRAADPLFHRAVLMSPGLPRRTGGIRRFTAQAALLSPGRPGARPTRAYLESLSPNQLRRAYRRFAALHSTDCAVGPYPLELGQLRPVPMLVGTMHDEFVTYPLVVDTDRLLRRVIGALRLPKVLSAWLVAPVMVVLGVPLRTLRSWCRFVSTSKPVRPLGRTVGDRAIRRWASAIAEGALDRGATVWAYEFIGGRDGDRVGELGHYALHRGELPQLFDTLTVGRADVAAACGPDAVRRLSGAGGPAAAFRAAVVDIAHGYSPGWSRFTAPERTARVFDMSGEVSESDTSAPRTVADPWRPLRQLLGQLY
ncbi:MAG: carboxylesterase family protein [Corynebacterium sp.]|uniref:carboxylesterase family protein n=1 Tax=Corynebacterium TaxID=1716 RepID=UPI0026479A40|nr:carboxylesterase family protein [Corynebacterium sp.]MDN5721855.1 carboxylesterase family protein [Corynebacterium sp.]MDN6283169.1 carboxylesterase family protein [Corynebacterium sp.]MDN6304276.1 carboxylesterase family protein [Corynebacterium sp.]MDN6366399.1 carboxylesterase family protein [Corynebacterium sp.]MDN6394746.1 carboxylesterase family protein [Corynebacterium sp.]